MTRTEPITTERFDFFIGCNQINSWGEQISLQDMMHELCKEFAEMELAFSMIRQFGGYYHRDGTFVCENSVRITIIGTLSDEDIQQSIDILKDHYHQETVLMIRTRVAMEYLKGAENEEV